MQEVLGLGITVPDLDTDCFGTFPGDIPRIGTMRETAERKAWAAIEANGLPLACKVPGFGVIGRRGGLPCRDCGCPTDAPIADVKGCARCTYSKRSKCRVSANVLIQNDAQSAIHRA